MTGDVRVRQLMARRRILIESSLPGSITDLQRRTGLKHRTVREVLRVLLSEGRVVEAPGRSVRNLIIDLAPGVIAQRANGDVFKTQRTRGLKRAPVVGSGVIAGPCYRRGSRWFGGGLGKML
jgi:hypothetical protein